jgi:nicotinamidase-related amidase
MRTRTLPDLTLPAHAALLLVDLQQAVDNPSWGPRNNPHAERNAACLLEAWRAMRRPIYHVRHDSTEPMSTCRPGQVGNTFKPEVAPLPDETVVVKHTNSAFIGTDLEAQLRAAGHDVLVVVGVASSISVDATVRMAGNLGFATYLVDDATFTFDRIDWAGTRRTAQEVHDMALANLDGEYCTMLDTAAVLNAIAERH